jgi:uncharacterized protein YqgQ
MNFYLRINRLTRFQQYYIRKNLFQDNVVDYGLLKKLAEDIKYQNLFSKLIKQPVFRNLYYHYLSKYPIDEKVQDVSLYLEISKDLIDQGMVTLINENTEPDIIVIPELEIKDKKLFNEFSKRILKEFSFLILFEKRMYFLKSLLDEISSRGPFNQDEILRIKADLEMKIAKFDKYIIGNSKVPVLNKKDEIKLKQIRSFPLELKNTHESKLANNSSFIEAFNLLRKKNLISEQTSLQQFCQLFKAKGLEENEFIEWTGTFIELKWTIVEITNKVKNKDYNGLNKWKIAQNCFTMIVRGKSKNIERYTQISNSSGGDSNRKFIHDFGRKLQEL